MNRIYNCTIIEDEPLAQNVLKKYIKEHPSLELLSVFMDALQAQPFIMQEKPDILFLDINLPKLSGINFLKTLSQPPLVIFTTAYSEFAIEGFELDAVDYLLKPFSFERFLKAVNKAIEKLNSQPVSITPAEEHIFLKADKKVYKIDLSSINYVEATGDYVKVITENNQLIVNNTMKNLLQELPSSVFLRVHKSYIINKNKIVFIEGNYIKLSNTEIPIGASYKEDVMNSFK